MFTLVPVVRRARSVRRAAGFSPAWLGIEKRAGYLGQSVISQSESGEPLMYVDQADFEQKETKKTKSRASKTLTSFPSFPSVSFSRIFVVDGRMDRRTYSLSC